MSKIPRESEHRQSRRKERAQAEGMPVADSRRIQDVVGLAPPSSARDAKNRKPIRKEGRDLQPVDRISVDFSYEATKGELGNLVMMATEDLLVDFRYQRPNTQRLLKTVRDIASNFDWRKFAPIVVAPLDDKHVVIDGRQRVMAAKSVGEEQVPCYVIDCPPEMEASVFLDANRNRTSVNERDVWFANLAAGDVFTHEVRDFLDLIGVTVVRNSTGAVAGETPYPRCLENAYGEFGSGVLDVALKCIVQTGDGNPGMITPSMVNGLARALKGHEDLFQKELAVYKAFDKVRLRDIDISARAERNAHGGKLVSIIETRIKSILAPVFA